MSFTFQDFPVAGDDLRSDVLAGLTACPKAIPPKYFYDEPGCRLFEAICAQPEYALCRTERALMASRLPDIATAVGPVDCIVEPGAGECSKVRLLLDALHPAHLVVLDIAGAPLAAAAQACSPCRRSRYRSSSMAGRNLFPAWSRAYARCSAASP